MAAATASTEEEADMERSLFEDDPNVEEILKPVKQMTVIPAEAFQRVVDVLDEYFKSPPPALPPRVPTPAPVVNPKEELIERRRRGQHHEVPELWPPQENDDLQQLPIPQGGGPAPVNFLRQYFANVANQRLNELKKRKRREDKAKGEPSKPAKKRREERDKSAVDQKERAKALEALQKQKREKEAQQQLKHHKQQHHVPGVPARTKAMARKSVHSTKDKHRSMPVQKAVQNAIAQRTKRNEEEERKKEKFKEQREREEMIRRMRQEETLKKMQQKVQSSAVPQAVAGLPNVSRPWDSQRFKYKTPTISAQPARTERAAPVVHPVVKRAPDKSHIFADYKYNPRTPPNYLDLRTDVRPAFFKVHDPFKMSDFDRQTTRIFRHLTIKSTKVALHNRINDRPLRKADPTDAPRFAGRGRFRQYTDFRGYNDRRRFQGKRHTRARVDRAHELMKSTYEQEMKANQDTRQKRLFKSNLVSLYLYKTNSTLGDKTNATADMLKGRVHSIDYVPNYGQRRSYARFLTKTHKLRGTKHQLELRLHKKFREIRDRKMKTKRIETLKAKVNMAKTTPDLFRAQYPTDDFDAWRSLDNNMIEIMANNAPQQKQQTM